MGLEEAIVLLVFVPFLDFLLDFLGFVLPKSQKAIVSWGEGFQARIGGFIYMAIEEREKSNSKQRVKKMARIMRKVTHT